MYSPFSRAHWHPLFYSIVSQVRAFVNTHFHGFRRVTSKLFLEKCEKGVDKWKMMWYTNKAVAKKRRFAGIDP